MRDTSTKLVLVGQEEAEVQQPRPDCSLKERRKSKCSKFRLSSQLWQNEFLSRARIGRRLVPLLSLTSRQRLLHYLDARISHFNLQMEFAAGFYVLQLYSPGIQQTSTVFFSVFPNWHLTARSNSLENKAVTKVSSPQPVREDELGGGKEGKVVFCTINFFFCFN